MSTHHILLMLGAIAGGLVVVVLAILIAFIVFLSDPDNYR